MNAVTRLGLWIAVFWTALGSTLLAQPYGLATRPAFEAFLGGKVPPAAPVLSGNWSAVVAFPNLTFLNPMGLLPLPGTSNLVVWEREGRIYTFANDPAASVKTLMLDLHNQVQGWDDSGLMGLAFHPGFVTNRFLFVYYTYVPPGTVLGNANNRPPTATPNRDRLVRYVVDVDGVVVAGSETVFIDQVSQTVWHNGGGMFFHPDNGFLYLTNGDDANGGNNQRINLSLHSGVLRIDVDRRGGDISHPIPRQPSPAGSRTANYYIPNDNPFVGQPGVLEEFFAIGLRSPHRMTIDPPTGRIFIGDVGDGSSEELDVIEPTDPAGLNFQWNRIEGKHGNLTPPFLGVDRPPLLDYPHSEGAAIIGGYVYRGQEFVADLGGRYIFGDNIANVIWVLDESTTPATKQVLCTIPRGTGPNSGNDYVGLSSFGYDQQNELYMCQLSSLGGHIYKLKRGGPPVRSLPRLLSETGVFTDLATLNPQPGLIGYTVNSPLWSDGAVKTRWMGIPDGRKIGFADQGEWTFPEGSVWVKHFELPVNETNPAVRQRLETRLLVRDTNGYVYGASYKWRPDNSDAEIVNGAVTENIAVTVAPPVGDLTSVDIGGPAAGSTTETDGAYQLTAGGADIWGASDQFRFAHQQRAGDFDIAVQVQSLSQADLYTKAGLMVRDSLAPNARHIFALVFPSNASRNNNDGGYEFQSRDTVGGNASAIYPPAPQPRVGFPNTWLRLKRAGQTFTAYSSPDGQTWRLYATKTLTLPDTVYFGFALTAHTGSGAKATARFSFRERRLQPWYFPSRQDCLSCHSRASGGVLGVKTRQSNGDHHFSQTGVTDNQLRAWNHAGYFEPALDENALPTLLKLVAVTNEAASLETRVRSYLDANCSHCHRPGGVPANWDARIETPLGLANIIGGDVVNDLGVPGARTVAAKDLSRSIMHRRMNTATEPYRMPPLARNVVDQAAVNTLAAWIGTLAPPPNVTLTTPASGSLYYAPAVIPLAASASSSNGEITRVEYFAGLNKLGEATNAPFQLVWEPTESGTFEITAFATDSARQTGKSAPLTVTVVAAGTPGLLAEYFDNINLTGKKLTRVDSKVDFDWVNGSPDPRLEADTFSVRWTGRIQPRFSQTYTFTTTTDDGVRLFVNGQRIINQWVDQSPTSWTGTIALQANQMYTIRLDFYENGGGAMARLEWSSASQPRQVVPASALRPPAPPNAAPTVSLRTPGNSSLHYQPGVLELEAEAADADGRVVKVEFFADGGKLGELAAAPFVWRWPAPAVGEHLLFVRATDDGGLSTSSTPVPLTVAALQMLPPSQPAADGRFHLSLAASDGLRYRLESSTNLVEWMVINTSTAANGRVEFSELADGQRRFYRAVPAP